MCSQKSSSLQKYPSSAIDQYQHCNFLSFVTRNGFPGRISSWYMQTLCGVCNEGWCLATCFRNASLNPTHSVQRNHSSAMGLIIGYFLFGPFSISTSTSPQRGPNGVSFGRASDLSRFTVLCSPHLGAHVVGHVAELQPTLIASQRTCGDLRRKLTLDPFCRRAHPWDPAARVHAWHEPCD